MPLPLLFTVLGLLGSANLIGWCTPPPPPPQPQVSKRAALWSPPPPLLGLSKLLISLLLHKGAKYYADTAAKSFAGKFAMQGAPQRWEFPISYLHTKGKWTQCHFSSAILPTKFLPQKVSSVSSIECVHIFMDIKRPCGVHSVSLFIFDKFATLSQMAGFREAHRDPDA